MLSVKRTFIDGHFTEIFYSVEKLDQNCDGTSLHGLIQALKAMVSLIMHTELK